MRLLVGLGVAGLLCMASPLGAYEIARAADGQLLRGARLPLSLRVDVEAALLAGEDRGELGAASACRAAALAWEAASRSAAHFVRAGAPQDSGEGSPVVVEAVRDDWPLAYGSENATLAFTVVEVDEQARQVDSAHVYLNGVGFAFSSTDSPRQIDLQGTVAHELGHALGLEHSCGEPFGAYPDCSRLPEDVRASVEEATMYPAASRGNIWQRDLASDDRQGLQSLYGVERADPPKLRVSCSCAPHPVLICERAAGDLRAYQAGQVFARGQPGDPCLAGPDGTFDPSQLFDLELTDPDNGKRALLLERRCPPCVDVDAGAARPPWPEPGCSCSLSGASASLWLWWPGIAALWRRKRARMKHRSILLPCALLLLAADAQAYLCSRVPANGPSLWWGSRQLSYVIHQRGADAIAGDAELEATRRSFATWQQVACSDVTFVDAGLSQQRLVGYDWENPDDNENLIIWRHGDAGDLVDSWRHERGSIAVTTTTFNSRTGELLDADIELNALSYTFTACSPGEPGCSVAYDVQNTLTHEIGHFLGLDHPPLSQPGVSDTTMYASAPRGETKKRDLDDDDVDGLCFLYPDGVDTGHCYDVTLNEGPPPSISQVGSDPDMGCGCAALTGSSRPADPGLLVLTILCLAVLKRLD